MIHRDDEFASEGLSDLVAAYRGHYGGIKQKIITDGVRELSEMFTGQRPHVPGYLARHNLRQAYVCYYLPINHAKIRRVPDLTFQLDDSEERAARIDELLHQTRTGGETKDSKE